MRARSIVGGFLGFLIGIRREWRELGCPACRDEKRIAERPHERFQLFTSEAHTCH